jgi:hypothetical protein
LIKLQQEVNDEQKESEFGSKNINDLVSQVNKQVEESSSLMRKLENNK